MSPLQEHVLLEPPTTVLEINKPLGVLIENLRHRQNYENIHLSNILFSFQKVSVRCRNWVVVTGKFRI